MMTLKLWGVRGSIPTPGKHTVKYGGNTSCMELNCGETRIVIDAGSGIRLLGKKLSKELAGQSAVLHLLMTHTHWDHIQGFPFFLPAYIKGHQLNVYGYGGTVESIRKAFWEQMQSAYFPVSMDEMSDLRFIEMQQHRFQIDDVTVDALRTNHPGLCMAYKVTYQNTSVVWLCDHELYTPFATLSTPNECGTIDRAKLEDERVGEFIAGADLVLADAQYTEQEYAHRLGWGHSSAEHMAHFVSQHRVKDLYLAHHDPEHSDSALDELLDKLKNQYRESPMRLNMAYEGMEMTVRAS